MEKDSKVLNELGSIVGAVKSVFFREIVEYINKLETERMYQSAYRKYQSLGIASEFIQPKKSDLQFQFPRVALKRALADVNLLYSHSEGCSQYVTQALEKYRGVVSSLLKMDENVVKENPKELIALVGLGGICGTMTNTSSFNPTITGCCKSQRYEAEEAAKRAQQEATIKGMFRDNSAPRVKSLADALQDYLGMCSECPYMEQARLQGEKPKNTMEGIIRDVTQKFKLF